MRVAAALLTSLALAATAGAGTVPSPIVDSVRGRVVGWARSAPDWFAVYIDRKGGDWCGLRGASWRMALVETTRLPAHAIADRLIARAMCGNELAWVRAGRFSDGRHREVAFMLWTTPSIGATTRMYRIDGGRFRRLARFAGDRVVLGRGIVTVSFENRGRSPHGELEDVYRFDGVHYRLASRRKAQTRADLRRAWPRSRSTVDIGRQPLAATANPHFSRPGAAVRRPKS